MFDPIALLDVARQIAGRDAPEESHFRSAINRAYFGVHLKASWGLEAAELYVPRKDGTDHGKVIEVLRRRRRSAGDRLDTLRRVRDRADYTLDQPITPQDWQEAEHLADRVVFFLQPDWDRLQARS